MSSLLRIATASALLLLVLAGVGGASAQASFPGTPGEIVFSRNGTGPSPGMFDLWAQQRFGRQHPLTRSAAASETEATFSADGRLIAYVRREEGDADIWLMNADGGNKRPLVSGESDDLQPSFFPGGRSLVFTRFDGSRSWTALSVRLDGSQVRRQAGSATFPVVSPNGRLLAYSASENGGGIRIKDLRTETTVQLSTGSAQDLDFAPGGRRLAFTGQRPCRRGGTLRFAMLTIALGAPHATVARRSCGREFISPAWAPDGSRILFAAKDQIGRRLRFSLAAMRPNGDPIGGAPRHRDGTQELFPTWQPLPR